MLEAVWDLAVLATYHRQEQGLVVVDASLLVDASPLFDANSLVVEMRGLVVEVEPYRQVWL